MSAYQYKCQRINYNFAPRHYTLQYRLNYWLSTTNTTKAELSRACSAYASHYNMRFSKANINNYASGKCCPKADTLAVMAAVMDVSEQWLTGYGSTTLMVTRNLPATTRYHRP